MLETQLAIDPAAHPPSTPHNLLVGAIFPPPIGFISTISPDGAHNLAPFSFFTAVCADPPVVCFASGIRKPPKDTLANARATGEFVVNNRDRRDRGTDESLCRRVSGGCRRIRRLPIDPGSERFGPPSLRSGVA